MDLNDYSVVKNLVEGYSAVYENQIEEKTIAELDAIQTAKIAQQAAEAREKIKEREKSAIAFQVHRAKVISKGGTFTDALDSWNRQKLGMKEDFDLFDYLLEYLVAEGYADTNDAAIAIMANMSEEWREEILDEATVLRVTSPQGKERPLNISKAKPATNLSGAKRQDAAKDSKDLGLRRKGSSFSPQETLSANKRGQPQISQRRQTEVNRRAGRFIVRALQRRFGLPDSALDPKDKSKDIPIRAQDLP